MIRSEISGDSSTVIIKGATEQETAVSDSEEETPKAASLQDNSIYSVPKSDAPVEKKAADEDDDGDDDIYKVPVSNKRVNDDLPPGVLFQVRLCYTYVPISGETVLYFCTYFR